MKALKKPILGSFFIALFCLFYKGTDSCGVYVLTGDLSRVCLFQPATKTPLEMFPFFYSNSYYFQPDVYNEYSHVNEIDIKSKYYISDYEVITNDWVKHFNNKVSFDEVYQLIFEKDVKDFYKEYDLLKASDPFFKLLQKPEYKEELAYFEIVKELELFAYDNNEWSCYDCPAISKTGKLVWIDAYSNDYLNNKEYVMNDNPSKTNLEIQILENLAKTKNPFLISRYAFVLCRMYYYSFQYNLLEQTYDKYLANLPDNYFLKNYGRYFLALTKPAAERNYLLSLVYKNCPEKRYRTQELFTKKLLPQTLQLAKNNEEKGTILIMGVSQNPYNCIAEVEQIVKVAPNHELIPFVITREINKIEDGLLGDEYTGIGGELANMNYEPTEDFDYYYYVNKTDAANEKKILNRTLKKKLHLKRCWNMLKTLSIKPSIYQSFYQLAAGYLSYINKDYGQANYYYMQNALINEKDKKVSLQLAINKLLLTISTSDKLDEKAEFGVLNILNTLKTHKADYFFPEYTKSQLLFFVGKLYLEKDETYKGIMLLGHSSNVFDYQEPYYAKNAYHLMLDKANEADYDSIIAVINKKQKTPFEKLLCADGIFHTEQYDTTNTFYYDENYYEKISHSPWDLNRIYDMKSTYHMQRNEIYKAYAATCHIDKNYWNIFPNDNFINDNPFWVAPASPHFSFNKFDKTYNKHVVLKELIRLINTANISTGNKKALAYFQIANFYLSITVHGKFWIMQNNYWYDYNPGEENEEYSSYSKTFVNEHSSFFKPKLALKYYLMALQEAKSEDLAAMSTYLAWVANNKIKHSDTNPYLKHLKIKRLGMYYYEKYSNCELINKFFDKYYHN